VYPAFYDEPIKPGSPRRTFYQFHDWSDKLVSMKISATEFKAKCLALIELVHRRGESIVITKHGRPIVRLIPERTQDERPWIHLGGMARWSGDPLAPAVDEDEIEALK